MMMTLALLLAAQSAPELPDRALLSREGVSADVRDPSVLGRLLGLLKEDVRPGDGWTIRLQRGDRLLREIRVPRSGVPAGLAAFLREQDLIAERSAELSSDAPDVRIRAAQSLVALGRPAVEPMRRLSESSKDAEVRGRAEQVLKEIHAALRPRIQTRFVFARKEPGPADALQVEDWIRKAAAEQGYPTLVDGTLSPWKELATGKETIYPAAPEKKPGGIYLSGQILEWTLDGPVVLQVLGGVQGWNTGKFTLDPKTPRSLIRLSNQTIGDLFVALEMRN